MRENWLAPIRYWDVEKIIKSKCRKPEGIIADFSSTSEGEKNWKVKYKNRGVECSFELGEFGDISFVSYRDPNITRGFAWLKKPKAKVDMQKVP